MSAAEVPDLLVELLAQAEDCLTTNGRTLPEHRFVSHNAPAWDCCDLLTVHLDEGKATSRWARPNRRPLQCATRWAIDVVVTILRCVPTFDGNSPPTFAALRESALSLAADGWAIYNCFGCRALDGTLLAGCSCDLVILTSLKPIGPQGGCAGYTFTVTVEPPGIPS